MADNQRDYSSIYSIKDFMGNTVKDYYNATLKRDDINDLNIGLTGIVSDLVGTISEDTFNTVTTFLNEIFPNKAILPETIYNDAALFQDSDFFAKPCTMSAWLFVNEDNIIRDATVIDTMGEIEDNRYEYFIDSDLKIDVEGIQFMLDYDIHITFVEQGEGNFIYTAKYNRFRYGSEYRAPFADDGQLYIKTRRITYNREKYLALYVDLRQVTRNKIEETVIGNNVINAPSFTFRFDGDIASFDVFCKEPGKDSYEQLDKKLVGTIPNKTSHACFYRMLDDDELEISFTVKDGYYKPEFGSDIIIEYTTTLGDKGAFDLYTGSDIVCIGSSEIYDYNNKMIIFCITQSPSQYGSPKMTLDELKLRNCENFSTVKSYTVENDLQLYFNRFSLNDFVKMSLVKKRNDMYDRLFTTYTLFRNSENNVIKTNTLTLELPAYDEAGIKHTGLDKFDKVGNGLYLRAGSAFAYKDETTSDSHINYLGSYITNDNMDDIVGTGKYSFVFALPFLMKFETNPTSVGYYLNTVDRTYPMDYNDMAINEMAELQFMISPIRVKRSALTEKSDDYGRYTLTTSIISAIPLIESIETVDNIEYITVSFAQEDDEPIIINKFTRKAKTNDIFVANETSTINIQANLYFNSNGDGDHIPCKIESYDKNTQSFNISCTIQTNDEINGDKFIVTNVLNAMGDALNSKSINMINSPLSIDVGYINDDTFTKSNIYHTMENRHVTFIKPLNMCKSDVSYTLSSLALNNSSNTSLVDISIYNMPLLGTRKKYVPSKYTYTIDDIDREEFFKLYTEQYMYIENIDELQTNNYGIDIKFYNTYGKSNNYNMEGGDLLDSVAIGITFDIKIHYGVDANNLINEMKSFIKTYIESINNDTGNSIYVSNIIKAIENKFDAVKYIKFGRKMNDKYIGFVGVQKYGIETQSIENNSINLDSLDFRARREYVPEYLNIHLNNIDIELI